MNKFKVGDVVRLKTGGPRMTIKGEMTDDNEKWTRIMCTWFVEKHDCWVTKETQFEGPYEADFTEEQLIIDSPKLPENDLYGAREDPGTDIEYLGDEYDFDLNSSDEKDDLPF